MNKLPDFANDDANLIRIAGSCIGMTTAPLTDAQVDALLNEHFREAAPPPEGHPG